ncbi:MAG: 16S rRNA (guanine966-N2)-methyltransferase [Halieaceae bacterium]
MQGKAGTAGSLRIIGGQWRGRKLPVPDLPGLRPTTDRIRETLFNWLSPVLADSRCLDLFAGSGALGLEALSRGAAHCDFVELERPAAQAIGESLTRLGAQERAEVHCEDALRFMECARGPYDLVFLDPPFAEGRLDESTRALIGAGLLRPEALVYVEYPVKQAFAPPQDWEPWRSKRSAAVVYELYRAP